MLLPDGRVFIGGGDKRTSDYQIYRPPYLAAGVERPEGVTTNVPNPMRYLDDVPGTVYTVDWTTEFSPSVWIDRVVLMAPGSDTHHSDQHQRYVELVSYPPDETQEGNPIYSRLFQPPKNSKHAPRGWYMLFVVTNEGAPSDAVWVRLE